jgi:hypothetical protein
LGCSRAACLRPLFLECFFKYVMFLFCCIWSFFGRNWYLQSLHFSEKLYYNEHIKFEFPVPKDNIKTIFTFANHEHNKQIYEILLVYRYLILCRCLLGICKSVLELSLQRYVTIDVFWFVPQ